MIDKKLSKIFLLTPRSHSYYSPLQSVTGVTPLCMGKMIYPTINLGSENSRLSPSIRKVKAVERKRSYHDFFRPLRYAVHVLPL